MSGWLCSEWMWRCVCLVSLLRSPLAEGLSVKQTEAEVFECVFWGFLAHPHPKEQSKSPTPEICFRLIQCSPWQKFGACTRSKLCSWILSSQLPPPPPVCQELFFTLGFFFFFLNGGDGETKTKKNKNPTSFLKLFPAQRNPPLRFTCCPC